MVVAGALVQPHWVPAEEFRSRLTLLSTLRDLDVADEILPKPEGALPKDLAHDRWLLMQPGLKDAGVAPGALSAVRRVAPFDEALSGWLLEPVHFHLAKDHLVLVAGAAHGLNLGEARQLAEAIQPLLAQEACTVTVLSPDLWLLDCAQRPFQLESASPEAAAGRNVQGYLPAGAHALRYRKLLNEIQMTWHEHRVNQDREAQGEPAINSVWLSGPVAPTALAAWNEGLKAGRYQVEDSLLAPRLHDDRFAWLDALMALDARLHEWLSAVSPPAILLCGDNAARWLHRRSGATPAPGRGFVSRIAGMARRLGLLAPGRADGAPARHDGRGAAGDGLVRMFTERP